MTVEPLRRPSLVQTLDSLLLFALVLSEHMLADMIYNNNNKTVRRMEIGLVFKQLFKNCWKNYTNI